MPFIDRDFINDLADKVDIVDLINKRVPLKKAGKDYKACCPFHNEKTPSFTVAPNKQIFHCFGCGESGGAIDFVMKFDHLEFKEAVETIAAESGITVVYDQSAKPVDERFKRYRALMQKVSDFFRHQSKHSHAKNKILAYAQKRGLTREITSRFELGFAPPGWDNLFNNFKENSEALTDLETMGLLVAKKDKQGQYYDRFRDRLMFPIHNTKGDVIAFGGRVLSDQDSPKYLNSPETPIFSKSRELYGLYHARKFSRSMDYILVVEGYMDVIALHLAGITRVVATLGTATTSQHLQTLAKSTNTIIFCFDGDKAGKNAAWKALKIALGEMQSGLVVKFLFLPDGEDPDTLVKKESLKAFELRIKNAHTLSKFLFDHVKSKLDFDTIEGKTLFLEKVAELIQLVDYEVYREQLIEGTAQILGQSVSQVKTALKNQQLKKVPIKTPKPQEFETVDGNVEIKANNVFTKQELNQPATSQSKTLMTRMIRLLIHYPILADGTVETRVRKLNNAQVLLELVRSAQMDEQITKEALIKPFEKQIPTYQRLKELSLPLNPYLSEKQAKSEFLSALMAMEELQDNQKTKHMIARAQTTDEQKELMERIQKNKKR